MLGRQAGLYEDELTVYRCLRVVNTGQWLDDLLTSSSEDFEVHELSNRTDIANALGLDSAELEALDTNADQRSGLLLGIPTPPEAHRTQIKSGHENFSPYSGPTGRPLNAPNYWNSSP